MSFKEVIFLSAAIISYFGKSQSLPLSLNKEPSVIETDLFWNGKMYCFRFLTLDAVGTENDLKEAINYGIKFLSEEDKINTSTDISRNLIHPNGHENPKVAVEAEHEPTNETDSVKNEKSDDENLFSNTAWEKRMKAQNSNIPSKNRENGIPRDIINIIFVTPKSKFASDPSGDEVVFPTDESLDYNGATQISTGVNIFDRTGVPAAIVASLLG